MDITFDGSEVNAAFEKYIAYSKRSLPKILEKQMSQLAIGAKGVKGLFQEALALRPQIMQEIRSLPARLNWRIKRESGSAKAEIARRLVNAGRYQASGWVIEGLPETQRARIKIKTQRGFITARPNGISPRMTIANTSPGAGEFAQKTGYVNRALRGRARDMLKYVEKKMASDAVEFSYPRPKFTKSISQQLDAIMGMAGA